MINFNQTQKPITHECTAPFVHADDSGEVKTHQIRVRYRSLTTQEIKARRAELIERQKTDPNDLVYLSETLAKRIESLPDLIGEDGQPLEITEQFLESLLVENLQAIDKAIADDASSPAK